MNGKPKIELENKLNDLQAAYLDLSKRGADLKELIRIIHNPGWTTPAELLFALSMVDALQAQVTLAQAMHKALIKASEKVSVQKEHA